MHGIEIATYELSKSQNMKQLALYILISVISVPTFAGFRSKLPLKWGKISVAEFSITPAGTDASASAIVLCEYGDIEITNRTFYNRHTRIKILNDDGLKYATIEIPYRSKNRHDVFNDLRAQTLELVNGRIVSHKVQASSIEDIPINDTWSKKKFTFPAVKPGSIVEYKYTIASLDFEKLDTWYFQREIPVIWSEVRFNVPSPFTYLVSFENNRELEPDEESVYGEKLQWLYNTKARSRRFKLMQDNYLLFNTNENRYKVWALSNMRKKIVMKNLPGTSHSKSSQPLNQLYPQVRFDLFESAGNLPRMFRPLLLTTHNSYNRMSEWDLHYDREFIGYVHFRLKTWSQYNEDLLTHDRFGEYLLKSPVRAGIISEPDADALQKINSTIQYVKRNFQWNGEYTYLAQQSFKDFIEKRKGSSAELNLILVNLLRQQGISSDPVLIRTVDLGAAEKMYPVKDQFNHVIATAEIEGKIFLFDATGSSSELNKLNSQVIGTEGWIVRRNSPQWLEIFKAKQDNRITNEIPVFEL